MSVEESLLLEFPNVATNILHIYSLYGSVRISVQIESKLKQPKTQGQAKRSVHSTLIVRISP